MNPGHGPDTALESAPYGKACIGCSRAKCKCIIRERSQTCERCHRMKRVCQPSPVVRKKVNRRGGGKTRHLEERLDSLVTLLAKQAGDNAKDGDGVHQRGSLGSTPDSSGTSNEIPVHQPNAYAAPPTNLPTSDQTFDASSYQTSSYPATSPAESPSLAALDPTPSEAEDYLQLFREQHLKFFPFIYIAPETSVFQIRQEYPFLWLTICANCCRNANSQKLLEANVRKVAAQRLLVNLERNMDLLLGLITYISWTSEKLQGKPVMSSFAHLARSMLYDMRLDKMTREWPCRELNACKAYSYPIKQTVTAVHRTNIERRAVLGVFIATASISWFLRTPPVGWTLHMEDCLQHLATEPEVPDDEVLVTIARATKILEDVSNASPLRSGSFGQTGAPPIMQVKALRANLDDIRNSTTAETLSNITIKSYLLTTEAMINELPLYMTSLDAAPGMVDYGRTSCFYACISAIRSSLLNFFTFPTASIFAFNMPMHLHFSYCTHILYRLYLIDDPSFDRSAITNSLDLLGSIDRLARRYSDVPKAVGMETDGTDIFTRGAEVLRATIPMWRKALEDAGAISPQTSQAMVYDETGMQLNPMDVSPNGWFTDVFTMGNGF